MNKYIAELRKFYVETKSHHVHRVAPIEQYTLAKEFNEKGLTDIERTQKRLAWMLEHETAVVFPNEKISILRTIPIIPEIYTQKEWEHIKKSYRIHEQGKVCNINPGYASLIDVGFDAKRVEITTAKKKFAKEHEHDKVAYLETLLDVLTSIEEFSKRYQVRAEKVGNHRVAETFSHIPQKAPRTFLEALQFFRLLHFCLWESFNYHNTIGRFDQYMLSYYEADMKKGVLDEESSLELLQEFFTLLHPRIVICILGCNKVIMDKVSLLVD